MSKIAGRIEKVHVDFGDRVRQGQLLVEVEHREIEQRMHEAEASLSVVQASIRQHEAELQNLKRQVTRYRELYEQQLISRQELEDLTTRLQSAQAQVELSRAQYRQSEASLNQFKINLENARIHAPMDGFVGRRHVHPGALVNVNTPIIGLVDLKTVRMVINMVDKDLVRVRRGEEADIAVDAFPNRRFNGKVWRISPVLDPSTRTGEVEIYVDNSGLDLRAEMFARVTLRVGGERAGILVPREAVVYRGEQSGVFVLEGNRAMFRPVRLGVTQQNVIEVTSGINEGTEVVSMGASLLKDGDEVRLQNQRPRGDGGGRPQVLQTLPPIYGRS